MLIRVLKSNGAMPACFIMPSANGIQLTSSKTSAPAVPGKGQVFPVK